MKFSDLNERTDKDLIELKSQLEKDLFKGRMKNAVGQLEDTSFLGKTRKDIARIETILSGRKASQGA
ncbi:MAG: 50S ribosomal protein L29 [Sorangiineae bacterium NIC37A_2]|jgi:large subunit ribosomal protein L29|nr:MAG: 50S ribosomal protein L29 [Sorangiineae bacterium NIC37A_2]